MACTVFLATVGRHKLVVFAFDFGVSHGVFLLEVGKQLANQNALTGQFKLCFVIFGGVEAAFACFLHEDFAGNEFFFDLRQDFGCDGSARAFDLLLQSLHAGAGYRLAVNDRQILRHRREAQCSDQAQGQFRKFHQIPQIAIKFSWIEILWPGHEGRCPRILGANHTQGDDAGRG